MGRYYEWRSHGCSTSVVIHLYRSYKTEQFIRNNLDSDNVSKEFLDVIRDVGQSPTGSRTFNQFICEGKILNLRLDPCDRQGNTCSMAKDSAGNIIPDHMLYSKYDWNPTSLPHEIGHTSVGGYFDISSRSTQRASETGTVQNYENPWRWWMGMNARTECKGLGPSRAVIIPSSDPNMLDTLMIECDPMRIPGRPFVQELIHPGY